MSNARSTIRVIPGLLVTFVIMLYSCSAICPPREDSLSLDLDQFAGDWYVAAITVGEMGLAKKCMRFFVNKTSSDSFNAAYTMEEHGTGASKTLNINGTLGDDIMGSYVLKGTSTQTDPMIHRVIAANYSSYVTMFVCGTDNPSQIYPWGMLLSKKKPLASNNEILDKFRNNVQPYLDDQEIYTVDHLNCSSGPSR